MTKRKHEAENPVDTVAANIIHRKFIVQVLSFHCGHSIRKQCKSMPRNVFSTALFVQSRKLFLLRLLVEVCASVTVFFVLVSFSLFFSIHFGWEQADKMEENNNRKKEWGRAMEIKKKKALPTRMNGTVHTLRAFQLHVHFDFFFSLSVSVCFHFECNFHDIFFLLLMSSIHKWHEWTRNPTGCISRKVWNIDGDAVLLQINIHFRLRINTKTAIGVCARVRLLNPADEEKKKRGTCSILLCLWFCSSAFLFQFFSLFFVCSFLCCFLLL